MEIEPKAQPAGGASVVEGKAAQTEDPEENSFETLLGSLFIRTPTRAAEPARNRAADVDAAPVQPEMPEAEGEERSLPMGVPTPAVRGDPVVAPPIERAGAHPGTSVPDAKPDLQTIDPRLSAGSARDLTRQRNSAPIAPDTSPEGAGKPRGLSASPVHDTHPGAEEARSRDGSEKLALFRNTARAGRSPPAPQPFITGVETSTAEVRSAASVLLTSRLAADRFEASAGIAAEALPVRSVPPAQAFVATAREAVPIIAARLATVPAPPAAEPVEQRLTLHLHPASLGRLDVEIVRSQASWTIEIRVETAEALRLMESERDSLHTALRGRANEPFTLTLGGGSRRQRQEPGEEERDRQQERGTSRTASPPSPAIPTPVNVI